MVSVLISTYNGEKYIAGQLDSLLNQNYTQFEVYIRDDGSTDGTVATIDEYVERYPQMFHKVGSDGQNLGAIKSFLALVESVDSDYYMFCDQDDIWFENKIRDSIKELMALESTSEGMPCCIFTNAKVSDAGGKNIIDDDLWHYVHSCPQKSIMDIYHNVVYTNPAYGCMIAFNKIARRIALEVDCRMKKPVMYHDEIICRICVAYGKVAFIQAPLMIYRRTGDNVSDAHNNARSKANFNGSILDMIVIGLQALSLRIKILHLLGIWPVNYLKLLSAFRERWFSK
mgnify:CR=1 FL=1